MRKKYTCMPHFYPKDPNCLVQLYHAAVVVHIQYPKDPNCIVQIYHAVVVVHISLLIRPHSSDTFFSKSQSYRVQ
jgi:hypothetical protein